MFIGRQNSSCLYSGVRGELARFVPSRVEQPSAVFCSARGLFSFRFLCFFRLPIVRVVGFAIMGSFSAATFDFSLFFRLTSNAFSTVSSLQDCTPSAGPKALSDRLESSVFCTFFSNEIDKKAVMRCCSYPFFAAYPASRRIKVSGS